ncbi:MAG: ABC transporter ATP-binding protein [Alphaproteobacteria bacterium]|nr:ABC transporter ATP-binding protein [Alphaproteobacteria bacterium]
MTTVSGGGPGGATPLVRLRGLSKKFGDVAAVQPLDLDIFAGDFFALLGPSGCGKTTLLRMVGGFTPPSTGTVEIDGQDVTRLGPEQRPTNMVFQGYGLFPHMTVRQNIGYGLRIAKASDAEIAERVGAIMTLVRIGELAERRPDALSGGQAQRVALARALVMRPRVLLLDEPLAALDLKLRKQMQEELRRIHQSIGGTFVFVTHDQGEAMGLANRIAVMEAGACVQEGGPEEIYLRPKTRFVSSFIGEANMLAGERRGGTVTLRAGIAFTDAGPDGPVVLVVRPEAIRLDGGTAGLGTTGRLDDVVFLGPYVRYRVTLASGEEIAAHSADTGRRAGMAVGAAVQIGWEAADHRVVAGT